MSDNKALLLAEVSNSFFASCGKNSRDWPEEVRYLEEILSPLSQQSLTELKHLVRLIPNLRSCTN